MTGQVSYHAGLAAEDIVQQDYARRGFTVAQQRWRGQSGEVDLIMRNGEQVIFVEVKKSKSHASAVTRLGRRQMDRLCAAAGEFIGGEPKGQLTDMRFDVALVDQVGAVKVIENAFMEAW